MGASPSRGSERDAGDGTTNDPRSALFRSSLSREEDLCLGARLRARGSVWGRFILTLESTSSTNDLAREYGAAGAPHGSLFLGLEQTRGRGRWSRAWVSSLGGLFLSAIVRPSKRLAESLSLVPLLAAVAVAEAIRSHADLPVRLRWPNDLFVERRKVGGVLCESILGGDRVELVVVGVGVNVNQSAEGFPADVRVRAASLASLAGGRPDEQGLAAAVVEELERRLDREPPRDGLSRWRELAQGHESSRVRVTPGEGPAYAATTSGVKDDGALLVTLEDGTERTLYSEDVLFLGSGDEEG